MITNLDMHTWAVENAKLELAAELLRSGCPIYVRALGTSMLPTLWPGDVLLIEKHELNGIQAGDIIGFTQAGRFLIHRVIGVRRTQGDGPNCAAGEVFWITRGDSLACRDAPVAANQILGKICAIGRNEYLIPPPPLSACAHLFGRMLDRSNSLRSLVLRTRAQGRFRPLNLDCPTCEQ